MTDDISVAAVTYKLGGYHDGRAAHTHMAVRVNGSILANRTYSGMTLPVPSWKFDY